MDVYATLVRVTAVNIRTGEVETYGLCDRNDPAVTTYDGLPWFPILQSSPTIGTSVFNGAFTGAGQMDVSGFTVTLVDEIGDDLANLMWAGADIDVFGGKVGGVMKQLFTAVGVDALRKGRVELVVTIASKETLFEQANVLTRAYAGNGQLEGEAAIKGVLKPWALGYARFCKPVLLDSVRQIYQVNGYGPVQSIESVFEGGLAIDGFDGDKPIADILSNNGPPQGKWWRNHEHGVFRLGSQPLYEITCHCRGDTGGVVGGTALTKTGSIIGRIIALTTAVPVKASSLLRLVDAAPQAIDEYLDAQETVSEVLTRLMLGLGGYYTFDENGNMIFGLMRFKTPTMNLDGLNRTEPTVLGINQLPSSAPVWDLRVAAEQCHFVHNAGDISGVLADINVEIDEQLKSKNKTFTAQPTPPVGAIEGDQWPDTSTTPTTVRRYTGGTWLAISNQITAAAQVPFNNGKTVEELRPAQAGSDVTGQNTAQFIANQGWGATALQPLLDNSYVPLGTNVIVNSSFQRGIYAFQPVQQIGPGFDRFGPFPEYSGRVTCLHTHMVSGAEGNYADIASFGCWGRGAASMRAYSMPVKPGDRVGVRALVSTHRSDAHLYLLIFDRAGNLIDAQTSATGFTRESGLNGEGYGTMSLIYTVTHPAAAYCDWMLRHVGNGGGDPYMFFAEPWMGKLASSQTTLPPYTAGPNDPLADRTAENTSKYFENQGALATLDKAGASARTLQSDSVIPDGDFQDTKWWGGGLPNFSTEQTTADGNWNLATRWLKIDAGARFDRYTDFFAVDTDATYRVDFRMYASADFQGWLNPLLHQPYFQFLSLSKRQPIPNPQDPAFSDLPTGNLFFSHSITVKNPAATAGDATGVWKRWQLAFVGQVTAGFVYVQVRIVRLYDLGKLVTRQDGSTLLSDADAVTSLGTSRYLFNQGALSTKDRINLGIGGGIVDETNAYWLTNGAVITDQGTAKYLQNQGALATTDRVKLGSGGGMVDENNSYWLTSGVIVTDQGTAKYISGQGALATKDTVTGAQVVNGTIRSGNGVSLWDLDNGRLVFRVGNYMIVMGNAFGSRNQFTRWEGPNLPDLAQCTEQNGVIWSNTSGQSYFGGGLSAGVRKNAIQSTALAPTINTTTGTFTSAGGRRSVTVSYYFSATQTIYDACPTPGNPTATLQIFRGTDASGTLLDQRPLTGFFQCNRGYGQSEPGSMHEEVSGSVSFDDNTGGTSTSFFARIINRLTYMGADSQTLSIVSIEQ